MHEGGNGSPRVSIPTPWGTFSSSGAITTVILLLSVFTIILGTLLFMHDTNLNEHRAKAARSIELDAKNEAHFSRLLDEVREDIIGMQQDIRDIRSTLISLTIQAGQMYDRQFRRTTPPEER